MLRKTGSQFGSVAHANRVEEPVYIFGEGLTGREYRGLLRGVMQRAVEEADACQVDCGPHADPTASKHHLVAVPISVGAKLVAVMALGRGGIAFDEVEIQDLKEFARQVGRRCREETQRPKSEQTAAKIAHEVRNPLGLHPHGHRIRTKYLATSACE